MNRQVSQTGYSACRPWRTASRIDDSDAANAACAAHFRFKSRMRELEAQFEAKASELRAAFLAELAAIREGEAA